RVTHRFAVYLLSCLVLWGLGAGVAYQVFS
ncbi:MAG: hypothetical protein RLY58_1506, partial [Pseudomonadota bacterium]